MSKRVHFANDVCFFEIDGHAFSFRQFSFGVISCADIAGAAWFGLFAEVANQLLRDAFTGFAKPGHEVKALHLGSFARLELLNKLLCQGGNGCVLWVDELIGMAQARWLNHGITDIGEVADRFADPLFRFPKFECGLSDVEGVPLVSLLSGFKEMLQEMLSIWCVTGEDIVEIPQKLDLVTSVKRAARNENAFQLQVGYRGIHNDGTNVLGAGEVVPGYRPQCGLVG